MKWITVKLKKKKKTIWKPEKLPITKCGVPSQVFKIRQVLIPIYSCLFILSVARKQWVYTKYKYKNKWNNHKYKKNIKKTHTHKFMWFKVGLCSLGTSRKMFHYENGELHMWYKGTLIKLKPELHPKLLSHHN